MTWLQIDSLLFARVMFGSDPPQTRGKLFVFGLISSSSLQTDRQRCVGRINDFALLLRLLLV